MQTLTALGHQRESITYAYKAQLHAIKARDPLKEMVYPNQIEAAVQIVDAFFREDKVAVSLIALPQVGKTGTFLEVAYRACTHIDDTKIIDPRNVFIITGMSDTDWRKQTSMDMIDAFRSRVYHRGQLNTPDRENGFYTNLANAENALIIMDECHVAVAKEQQISMILKGLKLLDITVLRKKKIRILEVSATPGATLRDTEKWGPDNHSVVILKESPTYVGFKTMIRDKRLHQSLDLTNGEGLNTLAKFIKATFTRPLWHIMRLPAKSRNQEFEDKFNQLCAREGWKSQKHSAIDRVGDIDYHMEKAPQQHTFLLIKEFWRAGKRLNDTHVGLVHDPAVKNKDVNVTAQGLAGRLCGNDKRSGIGGAQVFCDVELIQEYLVWIEAGGDFGAVEQYRSRNLKIVGGRTKSSKPTFADPSNVENTEKRKHSVIRYRIFEDKTDAMSYCQALGYKPHRPEKVHGKYITGISAPDERGGHIAKARKLDDVARYGLVAGFYYSSGDWGRARVLFPCYEAVSDTDTAHEVTDFSRELERFVVLIQKDTPAEKVLSADLAHDPVKRLIILDADTGRKIKEDRPDTDMKLEDFKMI